MTARSMRTSDFTAKVSHSPGARWPNRQQQSPQNCEDRLTAELQDCTSCGGVSREQSLRECPKHTGRRWIARKPAAGLPASRSSLLPSVSREPACTRLHVRSQCASKPRVLPRNRACFVNVILSPISDRKRTAKRQHLERPRSPRPVHTTIATQPREEPRRGSHTQPRAWPSTEVCEGEASPQGHTLPSVCRWQLGGN